MTLNNHQIILLTGTAGSGKDTSYNILENLFRQKGIQVKQYAFGKPLKEIVVQLSKLFLNAKFSADAMNSLLYKETPYSEFIIYRDNEPEHLIIRTLLQQVGTDILRKHLGDDIFAKAIEKQIHNDFIEAESPMIAIITDLRFPNELECIKEYCCHQNYHLDCIYIQRDNSISSHNHTSESYYEKFKNLSILINNNGSIENLEKQLSNYLEQFNSRLPIRIKSQ